MKLPAFLARKPPPKPTAASGAELGVTGTDIFGGILRSTDYNPDWAVPARWPKIDQMRNDPDVSAGLNEVMRPILSTVWEVVPGKKGDARAEEAATLVRQDLGLDPEKKPGTQRWTYTLRHALLSLPYGFMVLEKVWEMREGQVRLRKLPPRLPPSIKDVYLDAHGGLDYIVQSTTKSGGLGDVTLPKDKILVFVYDQEGSDFRGRSVLRPVYRPWYMREKLEVIDAIAGEKHGMGTDVAKIKGNLTAEEVEDIKAAMRAAHGHQMQYIVEREGAFEYRIEAPNGTVHPVLQSVQHHQQQIFRALMASVLGMGEGKLGSHGLAGEKNSTLMQNLKGIATDIAETFNCHLIDPWHRWNFGEDVPVPRLKFSRIDTRDLVAWFTAAMQGMTSGLLIPDDVLENEGRDLLGVVPRKEGDRPAALPRPFPGERQPDAEPDEPTDPGPPAGSPARRAGAYRRRRLAAAGPGGGPDLDGSRDPFTRLERTCDFAAINEALDGAEDDIVAAAVARLVPLARKVVARAEALFLDGAPEAALEEIDPGSPDEIAGLVEEGLRSLYEAGREQAASERRRQTGSRMALGEPLDPGDIEAINDHLGVRSRSVATRLLERFRAAFLLEATRQAASGRFDAETLLGLLTGLGETELRKDVRILTSEALGLGRQAEQAEHLDEAVEAEYSARLDADTCPVCRALDGETFEPGSPEYELAYPPLSDTSRPEDRVCEGWDRCRCLMLLRYETQAPNG